MKQIITFFAVLVMTFSSLISVSAQNYDFAEVNSQGDTLYYRICGTQSWYSEVEVVAPNLGEYGWEGHLEPSGTLVIPSWVSHNGTSYKVIRIWIWAFARCSDISSVSIPSTVTEIDNHAFYDCRGITTLTVPSSVTVIQSGAFYNIPNIRYSGTATGSPWGAMINNGYVSGDLVYTNSQRSNLIAVRRNLASVNIPSTVVEIGDGAFRNCQDLTTLEIPANATTIGANAFEGCSSIETLIIPEGVTTIGPDAFNGCKRMRTLSIPSSVTSIGGWNISSNDSLSTIHYNAISAQRTGSMWSASDGTVPHITLVIGSTVQEIPYGIFDFQDVCLSSIIAYGDNPALHPYNWSGWRDSILVRVPCHSIALYTANWSHFNNIVGFNPYSVTVQTEYEHGIVDYLINCDTLILRAYPNTGYKLNGWSNGDTAIFDTIFLTNNIDITASFGRKLYQVTAENLDSSMGSITGLGIYPFDTTICLSATGNSHYHFVKWSNESTDNPICFTVNGDTTISAVFGLDTHYLDVSAYGLGGVCFGGGMYEHGAEVRISADANSDFVFLSWSDGVCDNPRDITIIKDTQFHAFFAPIVHDTTYITYSVHDTTIVTDTIMLTEYVPVHDTTYINVHDTTYIDVFIYDTTVVTDTITLTEYLSVHDTTYISVPFPIYDTTIVIDTVTLTKYVPVHDTTYINVHDTTYIDVPFAIHDTTVVRDTTYIDVPYAVHDTTIILDTTYIEVPFVVHDTTVLVDTLVVTNFIHDTGTVVVIDTVWLNKYVFDTITVHDTTIIRDTTYIDVPYAVHDTTFLDVHDTTYIHLLVHDTTVVTDTVTVTEYVPIHDTTYVNIPVHDTTIIIDTVTLTEYVQVYDTTYITLTDTLTITQFDTIVNTIYDTITNTVYDTTDNYIYDTVTVTDTLWLTQYDTIMIHDTIIIQDTLVVGVNEVETVNAKIYTRNGQIVVEGADGNRVWLYDMNGRVLAIREDVHWGTPLQFDVPSSGTYMIKIGNHPARKVVVIGT